MRKFFRNLSYVLSAVALSVPLMLSGQLVSKLGSRSEKGRSTEVGRLVQSRKSSPEGYLDPRDEALHGAQFSFIRNSFIPAGDPLQMMSAAADGIDFIGWVYCSKTGEGMSSDAHHGLYSFDTSGEFTPIAEYLGDYFDGGMAGLYIDGMYHYYYTSTVTWPDLQYIHRVYNSESGWSYTQENITNEQMPRALCSSGEVSYGCFFTGYDSYDNPQFEFGKFDPATSDHTTIAPLPMNWAACAFGADGFVYAIDKSGYLQKVKADTGEMTEIGYTGCNPLFVSDAVIDIKSGRMFWCAALASGYGKMFEVNLSTGRATELLNFRYGDHVVGLNIMHQAWGAAPAAVADLASNFTDDSLTGTVSFTVPTLTYDGAALSGNLTYTVNVDGEAHTSGPCQAGEEVTVPLSFTEAASHVISVAVSNENGSGPREIIRPFIGKDTPVAPEVSISYNDGKFTVSWNAVTETVNGGYMDPSKVTYKVTRLPDDVVVAEATPETSLVDPVETPESYVPYSYIVRASWDGVESGIGTSNIIGIGAMVPPYREEFQKASSIDSYTIIDSNKDGKTWGWYYTYVRIENSYSRMNDWLISPSLKLEAGKSYFISIDAKAHNEDYPERLEIKVGKAPTAEAMTETVVGPTEISQSYPYVTVGDYFECTETGTYYVGIHGISDARMFYLNVDNLSVGAGVGSESPSGVEDFKVITDPTGAFNAVISGKAPLTTESGNTLESITKIDLFRDGSHIKTIEPIEPGEEFSYVDPVGTKGSHTYSAIVYNGNGASKEESVTANIGFAVPSKVGNVTLVESAPGVVTVSWTAPETDTEGTPLGDSRITYKIVNALSTSEVYAENVEGTSYTYNVGSDSQKFFGAGVYACNFAGESDIRYSDMIAAGRSYDAPYSESFKDGKASSILGTRGYDGSTASWNVRNDSSIDGVTSSDCDNGFISCKFNYGEEVSMLFSGKIDLSASNHPYFSVDIYNRHTSEFANEDINNLELLVTDANSNDWQVLKEGTFTALAGDNYSQWVTVSADLAAYKGKEIQIGLRVSCYKYSLALFDNIRVGELAASDLAVASLSAPTIVKANQEFEINAAVVNNGYQAAEEYTVEFYREGSLIGSVDGETVEPNAIKNYTLSQTLGIGDDDAVVKYSCKVVFAADANPADNEATVTVIRSASDKPAPVNLTAEAADDGVCLSWIAPNTEGPVTEGFDNVESWAYENVNDWTFVDADGGPIGGFEGIELPDNPANSTRAFFVFDNSNKDVFNETYEMLSGNKCLVSMFLFSGAACDDWAISPELDGSAQTISFWARSYDPSYPEHIEMLYSVNGMELSDFIKAGEDNSVAGEWTEYTFTVPEGTKYFAIRSRATDAFMLMIDDVTFVPANNDPVGYNVYRDDIRINESPVSATTFRDTTVEKGSHRYVVTAVYANDQESDPSNEVSIEYAGVDSLHAGVQVVCGRGFIRIAGGEGLPTTVSDVNGYTYYEGVPENTLEIRLVPGVYMVRVDGKTLKVHVK